MRFLFSNRRLWHTYYGILISISVVFILLSFLSYQSLILLMIYLALSVGSAVLALKMIRLNSSYYLLFDKTNFEIHRIFSKEVVSYDYEDVKLITKQASQIEMQFRDGKKSPDPLGVSQYRGCCQVTDVSEVSSYDKQWKEEFLIK